MSLKVVVYIDDGICSAKSALAATHAKGNLVGDLDLVGFVLNIPKSQLKPLQCGRWLGFLIDLCKGTFQVPQDRILKLQGYLHQVHSGEPVRVHFVASIVGQIISMSLALGSVTRLQTRALYEMVNLGRSWNDFVMWSEEARSELSFWKQALHTYNSQPIWCTPAATRVMYSDASSLGYGGYVVEVGAEFAHGQWSESEASCSSTWRELKAVERMLLSFCSSAVGA